MAANNCTAFPVYGQAFRHYQSVYLATTGLPATIGSTGNLTVTISQDGAAPITPAGAVSLGNMPGEVIIDFTVADMTAHNITVNIACSVSNSFSPQERIAPLVLTEQSGCALDQSILLFEQLVRDIVEVHYNGGTYNGNVQTLLNRAGNSNLALRTQGGAPGNGGTGVAGNLQ